MPTPISAARNLGPGCVPELRPPDSRAVDSMTEAGWEEVCLRWTSQCRSRIHLNLALSVS
jgi:hypothetical protein